MARFQIIQDRLCSIGKPLVEPKQMFGLEVGTLVSEIGELSKNGNETSSSRLDSFDTYVEYLGVCKIETEEYLAFYWHPPPEKENIELVLLYSFNTEHNELYVTYL